MEPAEFFDGAVAAFDAAASSRETLTRDYAIGEWRLRVRFAGPELVRPLTRALDHLRLAGPPATGGDSGDRPADLVVMAWSGVDAGPSPADAGSWRMGRNGAIRSLSNQRFAAQWMFAAGGLQMLDREAGRAVYWVRDEADLPYWETGAPMRFVLDAWLARRGRLLVHAAAVGDRRGAILLVGPGGSGKSSTALACLESGLDYLADDYVLLNPGDWSVRSIYATGKVDGESLRRLPFLADHVTNPSRREGDKALLFVHEAFPHRIRTGPLPVRAVVMPTLTGAGEPGSRPAAGAEVLKGLAASTVFQSSRPAATALSTLAALVRERPCFLLDLAPSATAIAADVAALLPADTTTARPLVSVIVPCHDPGPYLRDALASVCAQDAVRRSGGLEVVVVDDGSTEDIGAVLEAFAPTLDIRLERQSRQGPSAARNRGLALARGEWIAFLDADDVWPAGSLDARETILERHPETDVVHGRLRNLLRDGDDRATYFGPPRRSFNVGSMLFRRRVFGRAGLLDEALRFSEDVDFLVRIVEAGVERREVDDVCLYYRRHGGGLTGPMKAPERGRAHLKSWAHILKRSLDRRRA